MSALTFTFILWASLTAAFIAVMVYRAHLTQHETDQLFLNENASHNSENEHDEIVRRVNRIGPLCKGFGAAAALSTVGLIGVYLAGAL